MENLNAEQVKKDLKEIVDNYSGSWTRFNILSNALALINSQEQRIKELSEQNERLRANTVREMQAEIINRCIKGGIYPAFVASTIDQIAKEMLEGNKNE